MVVVKVKQIKSPRQLQKAVDYIKEDAKTMSADLIHSDIPFPVQMEEGRLVSQLLSGHEIYDLDHAADEMMSLKLEAEQRFRRGARSDLENPQAVLAHHVIQSFSPEDDLSPEEIHEIGRKTALELTGGHHQFIIATHLDKGHIHNHIIFNTTHDVTLKKFRWQKGTARKLFNISNKHADLKGAKILQEKPALKTNYNDYQAYHRQHNFSHEIKQRLDFLLKHSTSLDDFKAKAQALNLAVDFSGKEAKYKLLDEVNGKRQDRNIRDRSLSKKGRYSLENIKQLLEENIPTLSLSEIQSAYQALKAEEAEDFELKLLVRDWQVTDETANGIYLDMDFGLNNSGVIMIPARQVNKLEDGDYEIYIRKNDFFYFMNEKDSGLNRYMKGQTVAKQLSRDNRQLVLTKNKHISSLDQLIKEFEFLERHNISNGQQFQALLDRFEDQVTSTQNELEKLDNKLAQLNKISAALLTIQEGSRGLDAAEKVLEELKVTPDTSLAEIRKLIAEIEFEREALNERYEEIINEYVATQDIRENVRQREEKQKVL